MNIDSSEFDISIKWEELNMKTYKWRSVGIRPIERNSGSSNNSWFNMEGYSSISILKTDHQDPSSLLAPL